jgi:hypothetical protein
MRFNARNVTGAPYGRLAGAWVCTIWGCTTAPNATKRNDFVSDRLQYNAGAVTNNYRHRVGDAGKEKTWKK